MGIHFGSGRKDTGRTDKYSDETPLKDYQDYRNDNPVDDSRKQASYISKGIVRPHFIGGKTLQVKKQELTAHIQIYQETFSKYEKREWLSKLGELKDAL